LIGKAFVISKSNTKSNFIAYYGMMIKLASLHALGKISVAIVVCRKWVPERLDLVEIRQVEPKWRSVIGDQASFRGDVASY